MEKIVKRSLYYDFYGELLTSHQQDVYEEAVFNDMSLGELSDELGISRQAVHDLIRRCDRQLEEYEEKLHLVERYQKVRNDVEQIQNLVTACSSENFEVQRQKILALTGRVIDEL